MNPEFEALRAAVEKAKGVYDSTVAYATKVGEFIRAHANDPVALQQFADSLIAGADATAAALAANPLPGETPPPSAAPRKH